ncbi:MAG: DUF420 domain-containing protein [Magnetococcus sp. DMHC-8]
MLTALPHWNTLLNLLALFLALAGWRAARTGLPARHQRFMILALITAALFLLSYLIYHARQGITPFPGQGDIRTFYYGILIVHALSALITGLLLPVTLYRAARQQYAQHQKLARWTLAIWVVASLTGLVVYLMIYHRPP